jgi:Na+-transporting NADH:ubiquinone oxidoreductase subunit C
MSSSNDSIKKTLTVALMLCIVCSVIVSGAAVIFKAQQQENKALDRKTNILAAAGLLVPGKTVDELYAQITPRVVNLNTGEYTDEFNPETYDQLKASKDPALSKALSNSEDVAGIKRREQFATVYLVEKDGELSRIILPVRGYGLWSTLHGFLALEADANTVIGLGFYQNAETPGLGGEVDNPKWKALWPGKEIYQEGTMEPQIELIKGSVDAGTPDAEHKIDGLSGATLTSRGVTNLVQYWIGEEGFGPYLSKFRKEGV